MQVEFLHDALPDEKIDDKYIERSLAIMSKLEDTQVDIDLGIHDFTYQVWDNSFYFGDNWKLTLNIGSRLDDMKDGLVFIRINLSPRMVNMTGRVPYENWMSFKEYGDIIIAERIVTEVERYHREGTTFQESRDGYSNGRYHNS